MKALVAGGRYRSSSTGTALVSAAASATRASHLSNRRISHRVGRELDPRLAAPWGVLTLLESAGQAAKVAPFAAGSAAKVRKSAVSGFCQLD